MTKITSILVDSLSQLSDEGILTFSYEPITPLVLSSNTATIGSVSPTANPTKPLLSSSVELSNKGTSVREIKVLSGPSATSSDYTRANSLNSKSKLPDLAGRFGNITLPKTIEFGDKGQAQVIVTNKGNGIARGPIEIQLYASSDGTIDKNDVLLTSQTKTINLKTNESITVNLAYNNDTSAIAPGSYHLIARIDSKNQIAERLETNNDFSKLVSAPKTDVVIDWNATALNAIQAEGKADRGVYPTSGSRALAIFSDAVYDTVQAFEHKYTPYAVKVTAPTGASEQAAVAGAAQRVLVSLLPGQSSLINEQLIKTLGEINDSPSSIAAGLRFGQSVADQILALRANDGSDNNAPYVPPSGKYVYKPQTGVDAVGPNWGKVTPFAIPDVCRNLRS